MQGNARVPQRPPRSRVTIKDVAQLAGVVPSTVSKALNGSPQIPAATRERIREAAERLGYRPNAIARGLRARTTGTIGVLTDDSEGVFSTAILRSLEHWASERDTSLFLCNSLGEPDRERRHLQALMDKQVDGLILLDSVVGRRAAPNGEVGTTPMVYVYCYTDALEVPSIIPDDEGGARLATGHLLGLGRRRIGYLSGPRSGPVVWDASISRLAGYRASLEEAGIAFDPALVVDANWDARSGYLAARQLISLPDPPDAIFCVNDYVAIGALEALREAGINVPRDVALVGFDDRSIAAGASVPLTTVAIPGNDMGRIAIERIFAALDGTAQSRELVSVPCELIVRDSSGGPSSPAQ